MNNVTFETLQRTVWRLEAALENDKGLDKFQRASIHDIIDIANRMIDEATTQTSDTP